MGISWRTSDYDLAMYGPGVDRRMEDFGRAHNLATDDLIAPHGYPVFRVKYVRLAFPEIAAVLKRWSKTLRRPLDLTAKPYSGPEGRSLTSHDLTDRCLHRER